MAERAADYIVVFCLIEHHESPRDGVVEMFFFHAFQQQRRVACLDQGVPGVVPADGEADGRFIAAVKSRHFWREDRNAGADGEEDLIFVNDISGLIRHMIIVAESALTNYCRVC